ENLNPATDIYFSQGPMDVLDHSCSKLGFGGKMCLDGTKKTEEEKDEHQLEIRNVQLENNIFQPFNEIKSYNTDLLSRQVPVLILSVEKSRKSHVKELHEQLCLLPALEGIKLILYVEHTVDASDLGVALWRFCNNLDPRRDHFLIQRTSITRPEKTVACMGLDGTRKTKELDNFHRDWPNIIVADEATIKAVDEKWQQLNLGPFIPSPSLKFKHQVYGEEAIVMG
ncbi:MAG: UbiD family decarboxylase, partial [Flavisolibacter sp.]|nr:UbiD family decarboxylase [Flavisolibacter sp.]